MPLNKEAKPNSRINKQESCRVTPEKHNTSSHTIFSFYKNFSFGWTLSLSFMLTQRTFLFNLTSYRILIILSTISDNDFLFCFCCSEFVFNFYLCNWDNVTYTPFSIPFSFVPVVVRRTTEFYRFSLSLWIKSNDYNYYHFIPNPCNTYLNIGSGIGWEIELFEYKKNFYISLEIFNRLWSVF